MTLARLTVMGHERAAGLVMAEAMPAVLTAIAAGVACAIALPLVIGSAIDLSAFTGTSIPVRLQPDALALGLPAVDHRRARAGRAGRGGQVATPPRHRRHAPGTLGR